MELSKDFLDWADSRPGQFNKPKAEAKAPAPKPKIERAPIKAVPPPSSSPALPPLISEDLKPGNFIPGTPLVDVPRKKKGRRPKEIAEWSPTRVQCVLDGDQMAKLTAYAFRLNLSPHEVFQRLITKFLSTVA